VIVNEQGAEPAAQDLVHVRLGRAGGLFGKQQFVQLDQSARGEAGGGGGVVVRAPPGQQEVREREKEKEKEKERRRREKKNEKR
jgi:hypothetical protein